MTDTAPCPLCGTPALFEWIDNGNQKAYSCPLCTDFFISTSAERRLLQAPAAWRENASRQASQSTAHRRLLIIRQPPADSEKSAQEDLQSLWVPPQTYPR